MRRKRRSEEKTKALFNILLLCEFLKNIYHISLPIAKFYHGIWNRYSQKLIFLDNWDSSANKINESFLWGKLLKKKNAIKINYFSLERARVPSLGPTLLSSLVTMLTIFGSILWTKKLCLQSSILTFFWNWIIFRGTLHSPSSHSQSSYWRVIMLNQSFQRVLVIGVTFKRSSSGTMMSISGTFQVLSLLLHFGRSISELVNNTLLHLNYLYCAYISLKKHSPFIRSLFSHGSSFIHLLPTSWQLSFQF